MVLGRGGGDKTKGVCAHSNGKVREFGSLNEIRRHLIVFPLIFFLYGRKPFLIFSLTFYNTLISLLLIRYHSIIYVYICTELGGWGRGAEINFAETLKKYQKVSLAQKFILLSKIKI